MEQTIDVSVSQAKEDMTRVVKFIPEERVQNRTVEPTVNPTVPQMSEELVEVVQPLLQERTVEVASSLSQTGQKTIDVPQARIIVTVVDIPFVHQREIRTQELRGYHTGAVSGQGCRHARCSSTPGSQHSEMPENGQAAHR